MTGWLAECPAVHSSFAAAQPPDHPLRPQTRFGAFTFFLVGQLPDLLILLALSSAVHTTRFSKFGAVPWLLRVPMAEVSCRRSPRPPSATFRRELPPISHRSPTDLPSISHRSPTDLLGRSPSDASSAPAPSPPSSSARGEGPPSPSSACARTASPPRSASRSVISHDLL